VLLGRKCSAFLLPKITRALSQFVPALVSSTTPASARPHEGFRRFHGEKRDSGKPEEPVTAAPPGAEVIPLRRPLGSDARQLSVAHAFIQFLRGFQDQRDALRRWMGQRTYRALGARKNKGPRIRKGVILDREVA
jgi:hypothetical protein